MIISAKIKFSKNKKNSVALLLFRLIINILYALIPVMVRFAFDLLLVWKGVAVQPPGVQLSE